MKTAMPGSLLLLLTLSLPVAALAQQQTTTTPPPAPPCKTASHFDDFDFWVGEWLVYSSDRKRSLQGTNIITKQHENCLLMENWTSTQGDTGSSMNYYDAVEDLWRQVWVAGGYSIDYTGGLNEHGSMVLNGRINYYQTGKSHPFRGTWTSLPNGNVRQLFEQFDNEEKEWRVWFDGLYVKKTSSQNDPPAPVHAQD